MGFPGAEGGLDQRDGLGLAAPERSQHHGGVGNQARPGGLAGGVGFGDQRGGGRKVTPRYGGSGQHAQQDRELVERADVASELERRGLLSEPRTFLFTDSWDRSAGLALATRGKVPVACYHLEPRGYLFWSRPEDWVGRDGIFIESVRAPGALSRYHRFFTRYEPIGSVPIVRRGVFLREVYLYRGTDQICPFPFDGRFQKRAQRIASSSRDRGRIQPSIVR